MTPKNNPNAANSSNALPFHTNDIADLKEIWLNDMELDDPADNLHFQEDISEYCHLQEGYTYSMSPVNQLLNEVTERMENVEQANVSFTELMPTPEIAKKNIT